MTSFRDNAGREWLLEINSYFAKLVKARTGVNIGRFLDDGLKPLVEFLSDPITFVDVLFVLVSEQAEKRGVTDEQFGRALGGDAAEAAVKAFTEAFELFCQPRQRKMIRALAAKGEMVAEAQTELALKALADLDPISLRSVTNSAASSESIPPG